MNLRILLMLAALEASHPENRQEVKVIKPPLLWEGIGLLALNDVRDTRSRGKGKTRKQWELGR